MHPAQDELVPTLLSMQHLVRVQRLILPACGARLQELPFALRAFNVHMAICRLFHQEDARRPAAKDQETWVERVMQEVKEKLKFRTTSCPERLHVSDRLVDDALPRWSRHEDV